VVCLDGIFISDAHTLAMLPNIAGFTLDKELASAFIIITYESREQRQKEYSGGINVTYAALSD
jgi:hypothetical protein